MLPLRFRVVEYGRDDPDPDVAPVAQRRMYDIALAGAPGADQRQGYGPAETGTVITGTDMAQFGDGRFSAGAFYQLRAFRQYLRKVFVMTGFRLSPERRAGGYLPTIFN